MNSIQHKKRLHDLNLLKQKKANELRNKSLQMSREVIIILLEVVFYIFKFLIKSLLLHTKYKKIRIQVTIN